MLTSKVKAINGKLKRQKGSKYKKDATFAQYQDYAAQYCKDTLKEIGLSEKGNTITVKDPRTGQTAQAEQFRPIAKSYVNKKGHRSIFHGIDILYTDHKGQIYWTKNQQGKEKEFTRFRFAGGLELESAKYLTDPGTGYYPYLNPIYQHFSDFSKLNRVYLTEGEKKAAAAGVHGIPAVGGGGIHLFVKTQKNALTKKSIDADLLPELQAFISEYQVKELVYIHDQDALDNCGKLDRALSFYASIRNLYWACKKVGVKLIYKHIADSAPGKGLDDVLNADRSKALDIKKALASDHHTAYFKTFAVDSESLKKIQKYILASVNEPAADQMLHVERYTSEIKEKIFSSWNSHQLAALTARTGTGKTDISYRYADYLLQAASFTGRVFFCFPNNLANEQKAAQYSNRENNPAGLELDICIYNQYTPREEKEYIGQRRIINCHASRLQELGAGPDDVIIYDEAHKAIIDNYDDTESNLEYVLSCGAQVIFLTGTPFREFYQSHGIYELEIIRTYQPNVCINFTELTDNGKRSFNIEQSLNIFAAQAEQYVRNISPDKPLVYFIFIKSIERIRQLKKILSDKGIDIAQLYSDDDIKANSKIWNSLVNHGTVPTAGKPLVILTTPLLYESADVKNTNIGGVAIFGEPWGHNIRQIAGRFRACDHLQIDYFLAAADKKKGYYKTFQTYRSEHYADFEALRKIYDQLNELITVKEAEEAAKYHRQQKYFVEANQYLLQNGRFNEFRCVRSWIRERNQWLSNEQRLDELRRHFTVNDSGSYEIEASEALEEMTEAVKAKRKDDQATAFEKVRENLQYALYLVTTSKTDARLRAKARDQLTISIQPEKDPDYQQWFNGIDHNIRKHILKIISRYLYLINFMKDDAGMISIIEDKYSEFNSSVKQQLSIILTLYAKNISPTDKVNRYLYQLTISRFEIGQRYSPAQIKEIINEAFAGYNHLKVPGKNHTHFFRMLFDTKRDRKGHYQVKGRMTLEVFCKKCDTTPYNLNTIEYCNGLSSTEKSRRDTTPYKIEVTEKCNTITPVHEPDDKCPF